MITLKLGNAIDLIKDIPDNSVDLVFTDPPYGHNNNNNGDLISRREVALGKGDYCPERDNRPIQNDGQEANELLLAILPELSRVMKKESTLCCCCCGGGPDPQFARWALWIDQAFDFVQMIVWDKGPMGMGWRFRRSYETVLVAKQKNQKMPWFDTTNRAENIIRHIPKIIPSAEMHPTPKPVPLVRHFIRLLCPPQGAVILDPFMGGASTAIAAIQENADFIGFEIDPKWFNYAKHRIETEKKQPNLFEQTPWKSDAPQCPYIAETCPHKKEE